MNPNDLIRDAYRELDETGALSRSTRLRCMYAGIDLGVLHAANIPLNEPEETNGL
ncbi:hypothetical protein [Luteibacter sp. 22Crub2.1]|uniref:hypothetical protein n=1 Tax=Luteibacter sp. 22Crub2.1 TaxID=1283288 RepID=UPI0009C7FA47|nr:hypothetical protein [Luteibacter sp. 22Crub2.1]SKB50239.1 hypothetical protein SAMN05660880_01343 [Luteibacter sp. 22Crub2.1]